MLPVSGGVCITPEISTVTRAKINLSLIITGKRQDGMHLLHSLVAFCNVGDTITVSTGSNITFKVSGTFARYLTIENNLVYNAALLLQRACNVTQGAVIHLKKELPIASGIGGGSGDAAYTLLLLNQLWQCGLTVSELQELGKQLGADIPVCIRSEACIMQGIGEKIIPLRWHQPYYAVLINPLIPLPTADVFRSLPESIISRPTGETSCLCVTSADEPSLRRLHNDMELTASVLCPAIKDILTVLRNRADNIYAGMSGSGATCFTLCNDRQSANLLAKHLNEVFPDYWIVSGRLY